MTSVKRIGSADTTPASQVTPSSASSAATPAALAVRPARRLTAVMPEALRAIDWNGHMPTAQPAPVTMTRAQVQEQLAATNSGWDDDDKPVIPRPAPRQRQPIDRYTEHVLGFGGVHAHRAFGSAA